MYLTYIKQPLKSGHPSNQDTLVGSQRCPDWRGYTVWYITSVFSVCTIKLSLSSALLVRQEAEIAKLQEAIEREKQAAEAIINNMVSFTAYVYMYH